LICHAFAGDADFAPRHARALREYFATISSIDAVYFAVDEDVYDNVTQIT